MSGDWRIDVLIAIIGAIGLIVPGWLTFRGAKLGKESSPAIAPHGSNSWEHEMARKHLHDECSRMREAVSREHDETRRCLRETEREILRTVMSQDK